MGGSHETRLPGPDNLRIHESGGDVHIHDDVRGTKFAMPATKFKNEYELVKKDLEMQKPPFTSYTTDANGVRLLGELDVNKIEWSLEVGKKLVVPAAAAATPGLIGFVDLDNFVGQL